MSEGMTQLRFSDVSLIHHVCSFAGSPKCTGPGEEIWATGSNVLLNQINNFATVHFFNRCEYVAEARIRRVYGCENNHE
jgi:hypothetical protein